MAIISIYVSNNLIVKYLKQNIEILDRDDKITGIMKDLTISKSLTQKTK